MNPDEHADSIIHRLAAGVKVSALFLAGTIVFLLPGPAEIGLITILIMILYRVSGIKIQEIFSILKPLVWLFVIFSRSSFIFRI